MKSSRNLVLATLVTLTVSSIHCASPTINNLMACYRENPGLAMLVATPPAVLAATTAYVAGRYDVAGRAWRTLAPQAAQNALNKSIESFSKQTKTMKGLEIAGAAAAAAALWYFWPKAKRANHGAPRTRAGHVPTPYTQASSNS